MESIAALTADELANPSWQALLTPLGDEFIAEAGYPEKFNPAHFYPFWLTILQSNIGKFFVAVEDKPVGLMGCLFVPDTFSGVPTGMEHFWFVSKSARRGGRIGYSLLKAFEDECVRRGCRFQLMIHLDGLRGDSLAGLYQRRGYKPAERCFRKVV